MNVRDFDVYADCAASAPILKCAWDVMSQAYAEGWGNPNSVHAAGREARKHLDEARETIAGCINASPGEIAFTPSATAACAAGVLAVQCTACSAHEHKAVFDLFPTLYFSGNGIAQILASNETGEVFVSYVRTVAHSMPVFTDATAAVGQIPVDVKDLGVEALAAGGHKFGAFPGIGFVYIKGGVKDKDAFPGTPPVALAVAMAETLKYRTTHMADSMQYLMEQTAALAMSIQNIPGAHINTPFKGRLPNILSVRFDGVNARELLTALDVNGVYASAGSACTADSDEPSRVLLASGLTEEQALSTIRLSFCPETPPKAFECTADVLRRCVSNIRNLSK